MPMYKGGDYDDLMQEGIIGLMRAVETYDQSKGKFSTYAFYWIRQAMLQAMHGQVVDTVSLDEPIADDSDTTLGDMLCDGSDFMEQVDDSLTADNLWFAIQRELNNELQFKVFTLSVYDYPIGWIAAKLDITPERAKEEKQQALYKLRHNYKITSIALEWLEDRTPSYYAGVDLTTPIKHTWYSGTSIVEHAVIARDKAIAELLR